MLPKDTQCPETAEAGFVDDMIDAIGIVFLEIGDQLQWRRVHRESFQFQPVEPDGDFPIPQMCIKTDEEVNVGERYLLCCMHKKVSLGDMYMVVKKIL